MSLAFHHLSGVDTSAFEISTTITVLFALCQHITRLLKALLPQKASHGNWRRFGGPVSPVHVSIFFHGMYTSRGLSFASLEAQTT
jgi:hypothetical protein